MISLCCVRFNVYQADEKYDKCSNDIQCILNLYHTNDTCSVDILYVVHMYNTHDAHNAYCTPGVDIQCMIYMICTPQCISYMCIYNLQYTIIVYIQRVRLEVN